MAVVPCPPSFSAERCFTSTMAPMKYTFRFRVIRASDSARLAGGALNIRSSWPDPPSLHDRYSYKIDGSFGSQASASRFELIRLCPRISAMIISLTRPGCKRFPMPIERANSCACTTSSMIWRMISLAVIRIASPLVRT